MIRNPLLVFLTVLSVTAWSSTQVWSVDTPADPTVVPPVTSPAATPLPSNKPPIVLQPVLLSVQNNGGVVSLTEKDPSTFLGGVRIGYEHVLVLCDHIDYWQKPLLGVKRMTLDRAFIDQGPDSPEPGKVVFDSRASKLPQLAFRGIIRPTKVEIIRQPLKEDDKTHVFYKVLLHQVGEFSGDLQTSDGWAPHAGWAEEIQCLVLADIMPGGPANPRFTEVILIGRPGSHPEGKRGARLERLKKPTPSDLGDLNKPTDAVQTPKSTAIKGFDPDAYDWLMETSLITILFDDQGRVFRTLYGKDTTIHGNPSLDMPLEDANTAKPTLEN